MKKMRKNNKGFTLVELIIVIAVIAILSAVAAPQYIKYVERSRESNDATMAASIREAALVAALDPVNGDDSFTVTWDTANDAGDAAGTKAITVTNGDADGKIEAAIEEIVTATPATESKFAYTVDFSVTITDGAVDTSVDNPWASIMK